MNLRQALAHARAVLHNGNIEDDSLEGEIILRYILGINRAHLFSHLEQEISPEHEEALNRALKRRLTGEPTAYILGHHEFYGLNFVIDRNVLIPRPESELLVEKAINLAGKRKISTIADIGTGSGAIAISIAVNLKQMTIYALDISALALDVARKNCEKHGVSDRVVLLQGNMLEPLPVKVDLIIANLPYVKASDLEENKTLSFEPSLALNGGADGLNAIRTFCNQAGEKLNQNGCLLLEMGRGQTKRVGALLREAFPRDLLEIYRDLAGIERVVSLCLT